MMCFISKRINLLLSLHKHLAFCVLLVSGALSAHISHGTACSPLAQITPLFKAQNTFSVFVYSLF